MNPWQWSWSPEIHLPWSGNVAQRIEPDTTWFFGSILPSAGNGRIEKQAFEVASYGRQLGLITEVLLDLAAQNPALSAKAAASLNELKTIQAEIEKIKVAESQTAGLQIEKQLKDLKEHHPGDFQDLITRLKPLLGDAGA